MGFTTWGASWTLPDLQPYRPLCHADKSVACRVVKQLRTPIDTAKPGRILTLKHVTFSGGLAMTVEVCTLIVHPSIYYVSGGKDEASRLEMVNSLTSTFTYKHNEAINIISGMCL